MRLPMHTVLVLTAALAASPLVGCTVVNAPGDHRRPIAAEDFCSAFAEVACRGHVGCCPTPMPLDGCLQAMAQRCASEFGPLALDPRTGYSADAAARVFSEGLALVDDCSLEISDWLIERDGFQSILEGTVDGGERCDTPTEDDPGPIFSCIRDDQSCQRASGVWECTTRRRIDEPCLLSWDCEDGLYCEALFGTGTCKPREADGTLCISDDRCASLVCARGQLQCAPRTVENVYCGMTNSPL